MKVRITLTEQDVADLDSVADIVRPEQGFNFPSGVEVAFPNGEIYFSDGIEFFNDHFEYDPTERCALNYPVHKAMILALRKLNSIPHF